MLLIYLSLAFVLGVFCGSWFAPPPAFLLFGLLPLPFLPLLARRRRTLVTLSACLFALIGGMVRYPASLPDTGEQALLALRESRVTLTGMVSADPEPGDRTVRFQVTVTEAALDGPAYPVSGQVQARLPAYADYRYGDILRLTGVLEAPPVFEDFDYAAYLARQDVYAVMDYPRVELLRHDAGPAPLQWLHRLRTSLAQTLARILPEPQASLSQAVLLGMRGNLPPDLNAAFQRTGASHILAISGQNITIVLGLLASLFVFLMGRRRFLYVWPVILVMWGYVMLTGLQPPVVRAAIMGTLFMLAEYVGRPHTGETALALAAAVMVGLDPNVLWTASFQLSFCAMAGLAVFAPAWQEWGRRRAAAAFPRHDNLASTAALFTDAVAISLAAMAAVYPLLAYYFQSVAVVGLFATLLAIPALPGIIICTALTAFLGLAWIPLGWVAGWAAWLLDSYLAAVVQAFNALPFASIPIGRMDAWLLLACYAVIIILWQAVVHRQRLFLLFRRGPPPVITAVPHPVPAAKPRPLLAWFIPPLLILAALAWTAALSLPGHELKVSFLDVGQGEAILVQTGDKALLVDGGPGTRAVTLALGRALPFWQRDLDAVILTQPQADHLSGLLPVLDRYHIKKAYGPGLKAGTATARAWEARLAELAVPREALHAGQYLDLGRGIKLSALNPPASLTPGAAGDPNADGLVLRLDWNEVSFLLTADIDAATERRLIAQRALLEADVLKVAHHGSRTSTSQAFLNAVRPTTAVISAGARNPFGHPHPEVLDRLQSSLKPGNIYLTSTAGTVTFTTDGSHLWVRSGT